MLDVLMAMSLAAGSSAPVIVQVEKTERDHTCVCSHGPVVAPVAPGAATFFPDGGRGQHAMVWIQSEERREETRDGKAPHAPKNIFIYKTQSGVGGDADGNGDGRITRKEFLNKAEAGFKRLDKDGNGILELAELAPPMPPVPPMPPTPHIAPLPPVPPVPPTWTAPVPPPAVAPTAPTAPLAPLAPRAPTMNPVPDPQ